MSQRNIFLVSSCINQVKDFLVSENLAENQLQKLVKSRNFKICIWSFDC